MSFYSETRYFLLTFAKQATCIETPHKAHTLILIKRKENRYV